MNVIQACKALSHGKTVDVGVLIDVLQRLEKALEDANQKIAELTKANAELTKSDKLDQFFSLAAHEKRMKEIEEKNAKRRERNKALKDKLDAQANQDLWQDPGRDWSQWLRARIHSCCSLSSLRDSGCRWIRSSADGVLPKSEDR